MDGEALKYFKEKKTKIFLRERIVYTGYIKEVFDGSLIYIDKYGLEIYIPFEQIERIEEARE